MTDVTSNGATQRELEINHYQNLIKLAESLERLERNRHFKRVIREHLLTEEPARLISLRMSPEISMNANLVSRVEEQLRAIGVLTNWIDSTLTEAQRGKEALEDLYAEDAEAETVAE